MIVSGYLMQLSNLINSRILQTTDLERIQPITKQNRLCPMCGWLTANRKKALHLRFHRWSNFCFTHTFPAWDAQQML